MCIRAGRFAFAIQNSLKNLSPNLPAIIEVSRPKSLGALLPLRQIAQSCSVDRAELSPDMTRCLCWALTRHRMHAMQNDWKQQALSKVPAVTLGFWVVKIAATTLGETGGDTVTMTLNWGYLAGTALFLAILATLVVAQIRARKFHPFLYWATIVASTTFGTTMADFADRSLGIGYTGGSTLLFLCLMAILAAWYWSEGTISVNTVSRPKVEAFYWAAITFSQTLGTALGDWVADTGGLGYEGGALLFGAGLLALIALYEWTSISRVALFWAAFILTRPLGATVGDFLDKPLDHGGLALSRPLASLALAVFIVLCVILLPQRAARIPEVAPAH